MKCSDGGVYVWQIETGSLDRVAHGLMAEDILFAANELVGINQKAYNNSDSNLISPTTGSNNNNKLTAVAASFSIPMIASNKSTSNQTIAVRGQLIWYHMYMHSRGAHTHIHAHYIYIYIL